VAEAVPNVFLTQLPNPTYAPRFLPAAGPPSTPDFTKAGVEGPDT
jgi:hypothetical protein